MKLQRTSEVNSCPLNFYYDIQVCYNGVKHFLLRLGYSEDLKIENFFVTNVYYLHTLQSSRCLETKWF